MIRLDPPPICKRNPFRCQNAVWRVYGRFYRRDLPRMPALVSLVVAGPAMVLAVFSAKVAGVIDKCVSRKKEAK